MTDADKLKTIVSALSERYHYHRTHVISGFHGMEAQRIKELLDKCGIELEDNHVGNARYDAWMEAKRGNE